MAPNQTRKPTSKRKIILTIVIIILATPILFQLYLWSPPPPPAIRYGEFPFRLEYELDGERFVIEDTLVASFVESRIGVKNESGVRRWQSTFENTEDGLSIILKRGDDLSISFRPGLAPFYMGDPVAGHRRRRITDTLNHPNFSIRTVNQEGRIRLDFFQPEEAHEILLEHGITLISWEHADPIVNSFCRVRNLINRFAN